MAGAIEHVSRHRINGAELQVIADARKGVEWLIEVEKKVVSGFMLHGGWPHRRINLFVFETLQPLVERLSQTLPQSLAARELDTKPMVHIYNMGDLTECSVFVNRRVMIQQGMWDNPLALEGLLAHEHAHPMAENAATGAARDLKVRIAATEAGGATPASSLSVPHDAIARSLEHLAEELCLHAPHEVFTNELAIRAGFGPALYYLNCLNLGESRTGMKERAGLEEALRAQVEQGRLSEAGMGLLLFAASAEAHVRVALETAAFARAGRQEEADEIEHRLEAGVFRRVEPEIGALYFAFYRQYLALTPDMDRDAMQHWAAEAFAPVIEEIARRGAYFRTEFYY
jgi:hypothetical protein